MKLPVTVIAVVLAAGCAATPDEIRDRGEHVQSQTWRTPEIAAACMGRALNKISGDVSTQVLKRADGVVEVIARQESLGTIFLVELRQVRPNVTRIDAWAWEGYGENFNDAGVHGLMAGCS